MPSGGATGRGGATATAVHLRYADGTTACLPVVGRLGRLVGYFVEHTQRLGINELEKGRYIVHVRAGVSLVVELHDLSLPVVADRDGEGDRGG